MIRQWFFPAVNKVGAQGREQVKNGRGRPEEVGLEKWAQWKEMGSQLSPGGAHCMSKGPEVRMSSLA